MHIIYDDTTGQVIGCGDMLPGEDQSRLDVNEFDVSRLGKVRVVKRRGELVLEDIPPPMPPIEMLRTGAVSRAMAIIGGLSRPIRDAYTEAEVDSWAAQAAEARAVLAGGGAEYAPTLALIAAARNVTLAQIAASVSVNAAAFSAIMVAEQNLRRQAEAAINAATTQAEIDAALAAIRAQVLAAAQAMGGGSLN
jgi:hypothetical protein